MRKRKYEVVVRNIYTRRLRASVMKAQKNGHGTVYGPQRMVATCPHASEMTVEGNMVTTVPGKHSQFIAISLPYLTMPSAIIAMRKFTCTGRKSNYQSLDLPGQAAISKSAVGCGRVSILSYH